MKKQFLWVLIILFMFGGLLLTAFFFSQEVVRENENVPTELPETVDDIPQSIPSVDQTSAILSKGGQRVIVRDFTHDADTYEFTPTTVVVGGQEGIDGELYKIFYFPEDGSVTVSLMATPFGFARELAVKELQESFGISQTELCAFDIWVSVPDNVSELYSGQNLGLSLCPGSVSLE